MTTSRLLTTAVQLLLAGVCIVCIRLMWYDFKQDIKNRG